MFYQGVILGLTLSFLIGPLLFSIVEAGLARGFRGGLAVAVGIWLSDVLFVALVMRGLSALQHLVALPGFRFWAGLTGGLILVLFGLGNFFKHQKKDFPEKKTAVKGLLGYFLLGFLLNTINPFTVLFWIGIAGGVIAPGNWSAADTLVFFGGMLGTLVLTDTAKAYGAKRLRNWLTPEHIRKVQRVIGLLLVVFGVFLAIRGAM